MERSGAKGGRPDRCWQSCSFIMTAREWRKDDGIWFLRNAECEEGLRADLYVTVMSFDMLQQRGLFI